MAKPAGIVEGQVRERKGEWEETEGGQGHLTISPEFKWAQDLQCLISK